MTQVIYKRSLALTYTNSDRLGTTVIRFQEEYLGWRSEQIHVHIIKDLLVVRILGVLTLAERQLGKSLSPESRPDGSTFGLNLTKDAKFTWNFTREDKTQEFSGTYTVADNFLILKQSDDESMIGQITPLADNRFTFKLAGDNPNDPGLTFGK